MFTGSLGQHTLSRLASYYLSGPQAYGNLGVLHCSQCNVSTVFTECRTILFHAIEEAFAVLGPYEANTAGLWCTEISASGHVSVHPELTEPSAVVSLGTRHWLAALLPFTVGAPCKQ